MKDEGRTNKGYGLNEGTVTEETGKSGLKIKN
jgi:hypothetical protein